jgi:glycine/D-amino acid oxidase-like deaminating enzyme
MTRASSEALVVGAGIVGSACAAALAREGFAVTVLDAGPIGGGATAAGMGHVVVMDDSEPQFALTRFSQRLWDGLAERLPASAERMVCGTLWVAADDEEPAEAARKLAYLTARGLTGELLDARRLYEAEPNLRPGLAGGLRVPADSVVYPPTVAAWLLARAGVRVRTGVRVTALDERAATLADGSTVAADVVVNAAGDAAPSLTPGLPVRPRKGHLAITDRHPGFVRHQLVELGYLKSAHGSTEDSVAFNVQPRPSGQLLIGSSRQFDRCDRSIDTAILGRMLRRATGYMPGLERLSVIRCWTGVRAATPDSLPIIGRAADGVWVAAGHEGLGITTSLGTAELLADAILGRPSAIPRDPYRPDRAYRKGHP